MANTRTGKYTHSFASNPEVLFAITAMAKWPNKFKNKQIEGTPSNETYLTKAG